MPRPFLYLFNLYFYALFLAVSLTAMLLFTSYVVLLGILFPNRRRTMRRFRRAINWYGMLVVAAPSPFIKVRYEYQGDVAHGEPCIFVCNHRSATDAFLMGLLPEELVQIVNVWPFRIPLLGFYAKLSGYLNIRMMSPEKFMENGSRLIGEGVSVVFFPEGTRAVDRKMGSFHGSAFRLALATKAPIVPICLSGTDVVMPKGSSLLYPGEVTLRRLPAIRWSEYGELTAFALKNRVWKVIDRELSLMEARA